MILLINACNKRESRTMELTKHLLSKFHDEVKEVKIIDVKFPKMDEACVNKREGLIEEESYSDSIFDMAKEFAQADTIVVAAPFWDLSFPSILKQYFEQVTVIGITFKYTIGGIPQGLCKAQNLYYVTTSGGIIKSDEYGYGYIKALANNFYGIMDTQLVKAEGLDIYGADVEKILLNAKKDIDKLF